MAKRGVTLRKRQKKSLHFRKVRKGKGVKYLKRSFVRIGAGKGFPKGMKESEGRKGGKAVPLLRGFSLFGKGFRPFVPPCCVSVSSFRSVPFVSFLSSFRPSVSVWVSLVLPVTFRMRPKGVSVSVLCCLPFATLRYAQGSSGNDPTGLRINSFGRGHEAGVGRGAIPTLSFRITFRGPTFLSAVPPSLRYLISFVPRSLCLQKWPRSLLASLVPRVVPAVFLVTFHKMCYAECGMWDVMGSSCVKSGKKLPNW